MSDKSTYQAYQAKNEWKYMYHQMCYSWQVYRQKCETHMLVEKFYKMEVHDSAMILKIYDGVGGTTLIYWHQTLSAMRNG